MEIKLHKFQATAWKSTKRIRALCAGIQSGKTTFGAIWAGATAQAAKPNESIIVCAPTYKILQQATLPKFLEIFKGLGTYHKQEALFTFNTGQKVFVRSSSDHNSCEGISDVVGIWIDEAGLIPKLFWDNLQARSSYRKAPIVITTTPYSLNWLYKMYTEWRAGKRADVDFFIFSSVNNPNFPKEEYNRQRGLMDPRRFAMKYEGHFGKMEGLVFPEVTTCAPKELPKNTVFYAGVDWGFDHPFAVVVRGVAPDGVQYRVAEFYKTGLRIDEAASACDALKKKWNIQLFVCDPSRPDNILYLNSCHMAAIGGKNSIRWGLDIHYRLIKEGKFVLFDTCASGIDEYATYHYLIDPPETMIDDDAKEMLPVDSNNHGIDADRYLSVYLMECRPREFLIGGITNVQPFVPDAGSMYPPGPPDPEYDSTGYCAWVKKKIPDTKYVL